MSAATIDKDKHNVSIYDSQTFGNPLSLRVDEGVGAMSISPSYRDVVLASRSGLFIIDLDDPFSQPRYLSHRTSWEVADVQWSPHASKASWIISTSNQKALVWNVALPSDKAVEHVLHGHHRAITDINFSQDPEVLATCSVDSFVHVWDLRDPLRPSISFADWEAGATQVKFNRLNSNIIGSTHDRKLYIWDRRNGSRPLHKIAAHSGKINGLDFNRMVESKLITCSNDRTVKVWDYSKNDTEPEIVIKSDFPVWRARNTPFGEGCVIMPSRGGQNSVFLHDLRDIEGKEVPMQPTHVFKGHGEPVKEFLWRVRGQSLEKDNREFQLVTWSKDHDLRLWPVSDELLESVHHQKGAPLKIPITRKGAPYVTYRGEQDDQARMNGSGGHLKNPSHSHGTNGAGAAGGQQLRRESVFMTGTRPSAQTQILVNEKKGNEQLNWIAGVRIGRAAFERFGGDIDASNSTQFDTPGNLGEEVSFVGHKFPKIRFEKISVATGICVISLNAPLGENEELVFIRAEIKFPQDYPFSPPKFILEEDEKLSSETQASLKVKLETVSERLSSKGRYCLEPCLRLLLGEQVNLEDYENAHDDNDFANYHDEVVFESSDDEDVDEDDEDALDDRMSLRRRESNNDADNEDLDEELYDDFDEDIAGDKLLQYDDYSAQKFDSTPLPKGCGAVWAKNGMLVCFFLNKKDNKPRGPPPSMIPPENAFIEDEDDYKGSDTDSFVSDSSDEFDSHLRWNTGRGQNLFTAGLNMYHLNALHNRNGTGTLSATNISQGTPNNNNNHDVKSKNTISIHDFKEMLPVRRDFAENYKVQGLPSELLAHHNAMVADKYGCVEIAQTWRLLELILSKNVSIMDRKTSAVFVNGLLLERTLEDKKAVKNGNKTNDDADVGDLLGRFNWGNHPFGKTWLMQQLFSYYERRHDVQMLAVMSCVLSQWNIKFAGSTKDSASDLTRRPSRIELKLASLAAATTVTTPLENPYLKSPFHHDLLTRENSSGYFSSLFLSSNANSSPLDIPMSSAAETPLDMNSPGFVNGGRDNYFFGISISPDRTNLLARGSVSQKLIRSNTQASIDEAPARYSAADSSPVNNNNNNHNTSMLANLRGITASSPRRVTNDYDPQSASPINNSIMRPGFNSRTSFYGSDHSVIETPNTILPSPNVTLEIVDPELTDNMESIMSLSAVSSENLLDVGLKLKCIEYRSHYSALLHNWGLQIESLDVLKFNFAPQNRKLSLGEFKPSSSGSHSGPQPVAVHGNGIIRIGYRSSSNHSAGDSEIIHTPDPAFNRSFSRICQYCNIVIHTRFFQCNSCEHVVHAHCAEDWWTHNESTECPAGCGCACIEHLPIRRFGLF